MLKGLEDKHKKDAAERKKIEQATAKMKDAEDRKFDQTNENLLKTL